MHVEKRKLGRKVKYYLAHSFREGAKVHKARKYLGANLTTKLLEERKSLAKALIEEEIRRYRVIRDPLSFELSEREIAWVKGIESKIPVRINHLSEAQWQAFSEIFTYNTNAIEGSTLSSKEVKEILENDKWPEKPKGDIAEVYGVNEAVKFIRKTTEHLSTRLVIVKELHRIVFSNSKPFAGQLRKPGEEVAVVASLGNIVHQGAPQSRIRYLLNELVRWYQKNRKKYPGFVLAAVVHNQFENIHPFRDGNGRVGRLLLNNILIKHKLPPINISLNHRMEYYASLQAYEKNHDMKPTIELFLKEYKTIEKAMGDCSRRKM